MKRLNKREIYFANSKNHIHTYKRVVSVKAFQTIRRHDKTFVLSTSFSDILSVDLNKKKREKL